MNQTQDGCQDCQSNQPGGGDTLGHLQIRGINLDVRVGVHDLNLIDTRVRLCQIFKHRD